MRGKAPQRQKVEGKKEKIEIEEQPAALNVAPSSLFASACVVGVRPRDPNSRPSQGCLKCVQIPLGVGYVCVDPSDTVEVEV